MYEAEAMELTALNRQITALIQKRDQLNKLFHTREYARHVLITEYHFAGRDADIILLDAEENGEAWFKSHTHRSNDADMLTVSYGEYTFGYSQ